MIGHYREHRLAEHGGVDGFQTECMLLPTAVSAWPC